MTFQGTTPTLWNIHRLNLDRLPALDVKRSHEMKLLNLHISLSASDRERELFGGGKRATQSVHEALADVKESIHAIFMRHTGIQGEGSFRMVALRDLAHGGMYALLFVADMRLDLPAHTIVLDAYVVPMTPTHRALLAPALNRANASGTGIVSVVTAGHEMRKWKHLLPALAERCRRTWSHRAGCAYLRTARARAPVSEAHADDPLCACGRGQDVAAMRREPLWAPFAPHATRIALSPLFAVSYLDPVGSTMPGLGAREGSREGPAWAQSRSASTRTEACRLCGGNGSPRLLVCSKCRTASYCSAACQKSDWKDHKADCYMQASAAQA